MIKCGNNGTCDLRWRVDGTTDGTMTYDGVLFTMMIRLGRITQYAWDGRLSPHCTINVHLSYTNKGGSRRLEKSRKQESFFSVHVFV